jgi:hypothetical protein
MRGVILTLLIFWGGAAQACRQALVLAIDVSASIATPEYWLQRDGLVAALRDPQVADWMIGAPGAEVELLVFEWGDLNHQRVWVEWTTIANEEILARVADRIAQMRRAGEGQSTAIGAALIYGAARLAERAHCQVLTIDVSGDGKSNVGPRPQKQRPMLLAQGITVNGLVVATREIAELSAYYHANVIVGQNAFVETAGGFEDYASAIKRKLLRELVPTMASLELD